MAPSRAAAATGRAPTGPPVARWFRLVDHELSSSPAARTSAAGHPSPESVTGRARPMGSVGCVSPGWSRCPRPPGAVTPSVDGLVQRQVELRSLTATMRSPPATPMRLWGTSRGLEHVEHHPQLLGVDAQHRTARRLREQRVWSGDGPR